MKKLKALQIAIVILSVTVSAILFTSCQNEPTPVESNQTALQKFGLPEAATFVSATFNVKIVVATNQNVNVHRITAPWEEGDCVNGVTWNNFGGYAPAIEATFNASSTGWTSVDVTGLVGNWLNGTFPNYGLLLDQVDRTWPRTEYDTREWDASINASYLEICYTLNGSTVCDTTRNVGDTYIYELNPDENNGCKGEMYTGWGYYNDLEKQVLVKFDLGYTPPPQIDCETAYAFGGNLAECFIGYPGITANNWGWSNLVPNVDDSYEWPIYAGAGQCDFSKGTLVGTLYVDYDATANCVTIEYEIDEPYELGEFHLWVDEDDLLPQKRNGKYTTAPGQFNHNGEPNPTTICDIEGPFWIAAHFGVCREVE